MIQDNLYKIISKFSDISIEEFSPDMNLSIDLGIDSMDFLDLVVDLGESYNVEVNEEDLLDIRTLGDIENYIIQNLPKESGIAS
jgi:acyl carrier protein